MLVFSHFKLFIVSPQLPAAAALQDRFLETEAYRFYNMRKIKILGNDMSRVADDHCYFFRHVERARVTAERPRDCRTMPGAPEISRLASY